MLGKGVGRPWFGPVLGTIPGDDSWSSGRPVPPQVPHLRIVDLLEISVLLYILNSTYPDTEKPHGCKEEVIQEETHFKEEGSA